MKQCVTFLKKATILTFLYTPSNAEFKSISSALQYSEFADGLIKEMLRASTIKECLKKSNQL